MVENVFSKMKQSCLMNLQKRCNHFLMILNQINEPLVSILNAIYEIVLISRSIISRTIEDNLPILISLILAQCIFILVSIYIKSKSKVQPQQYVARLFIAFGALEYSFQIIKLRGQNSQLTIFLTLLNIIIIKEENSLIFILYQSFFMIYLAIRSAFSQIFIPYLYTILLSLFASSILIRSTWNLNPALLDTEQNKQFKNSTHTKSFDIIEKNNQQQEDRVLDDNSCLNPLVNILKGIQLNKNNVNTDCKQISMDRSIQISHNLQNSYVKEYKNEELIVDEIEDYGSGQAQTIFSNKILSNIHTGIVLIDNNMQLVYRNKQMKLILDSSQEETLIERLLKLKIKQKQEAQNVDEQTINEKKIIQLDEQERKKKSIFDSIIRNKNDTQFSKNSSQEQSYSRGKKNKYSLPRYNSINSQGVLRESQHQSYGCSTNKQVSKTLSIQITQEMEENFKSGFTTYEKQGSKIQSEYRPQLKNKIIKYKSMSQQQLDMTYQQVLPPFLIQSKLNNSNEQIFQQNISQMNNLLYDSYLPLQKNSKSQTISGQNLPHKLSRKAIPSSVFSLFNRDNLNLYDILSWIFTKQEKAFQQNHWSSNDIQERMQLQSLDEQFSGYSLKQKKDELVFLLDNNNLIIHFKDKSTSRNFAGLRIGLYTNKDIQLDKFKQSFSGFILIEFFDKSKLIQQINKKDIIDYKNRMLASISHELRTPLNCSIQMLNILLNKMNAVNNSQAQQEHDENLADSLIIPALNSNLLLLNIINDIVDYGQIGTGNFNLDFSYFSLFDLVNECAYLIKYQASLKGLTIELYFDTNLPDQINSDPNRIRQVLLNLLTNSLKFTNQGQITVRVLLEQIDIIKIEVSDTGCGIPDELLNNFFETYGIQDTGKYLNTGGAGLGMSITNNLACGLGGNRKIQIQSKVNEGTTLSFFVVNRSTNKKGCHYKLKDVFNQQVVQWETFTRFESMQPFTAQSSNKILGGMKSLFSHQQQTQDMQSNKNDQYQHTSNQQSFYLPPTQNYSEKQEATHKNFSEYQFSSTTTLVNNPQQNILTVTLKPKSSLHTNEQNTKIISDKSFPQITQSYTQNSYQFDFKSSKNILNVNQSKYLSSLIENEVHQNSFDFCQSNNTSPRIKQKNQEDKQGENSYVSSEFYEEENLKNYLIVNESNFNKTKPQNFGECNKIIMNDDLHLKIKGIGLDQSQESSQMSSCSETLEIKKNSLIHPCSPQKSQKLKGNSKQRMQKQQGGGGKGLVKFDKGSNEQHQINSKQDQLKIIQIVQDLKCECVKILVVDDNDFNLYALQMCLKAYSLAIDKATSGNIALEKIKQKLLNPCCNQYSLILMDIDMPIMDGHETTQKIIKFYQSIDLQPPIISACSAYVQESEKKKAIQSGMKYYITKPINSSELEKVLLKCFINF